MQHIKETGKTPLISQHCPSVIEYIKIYHHNLLEYIAPFHSPTVITAKLIREILGYKENIAYLSPCLSKKIEFADPETNNNIQFNITIESLVKYMKDNKIDINKNDEINFDYIIPERGNVFCKPGGINNIIKRYYKNINTINLEGKVIYKEYLNGLTNDISSNYQQIPLVIDLLNCEGGCFGGPVTVKNISLNEENNIINHFEEEGIDAYKNELKAQKTFEKILEEYSNVNFKRNYGVSNAIAINTLSDAELKESYSTLEKFDRKDFLHCKSCGLNNCREFATSFFYKLNTQQNCRVYQENRLKKTLSFNRNIASDISMTINKIKDGSQNFGSSINKIINSFTIIKNYILNLNVNNSDLKNNSIQFEPIIFAISDVAEQINILSFNAAIEASRTGEAGKGFSVVAGEIRSLADKTRNEINKISPFIEMIGVKATAINTNINALSGESSIFNTEIETINIFVKTINTAIDNLISLSNKYKMSF